MDARLFGARLMVGRHARSPFGLEGTFSTPC